VRVLEERFRVAIHLRAAIARDQAAEVGGEDGIVEIAVENFVAWSAAAKDGDLDSSVEQAGRILENVRHRPLARLGSRHGSVAGCYAG
jgi:hypothetical protein